MTRLSRIALLVAGALLPLLAVAQPPTGKESVLGAVEALKPGEYLWAPDIAPHGPLLLIVSTAAQRATLYRNGIPIAITTVSTGRPGHRTPTGVFTILQRKVEHYSNLYDNAPMPYMQRLTWGGVALHGGSLPGYPASHGCIRLPHEFARLLYGITRLGMTVIITDALAVPRIAPAERMDWDSANIADGTFEWHPERATSGPVSVVISAADERVVVLRNGTVIGTAPVRIDGPVTGAAVFLRQGTTASPDAWVRIHLPEQLAAPAWQSFAGRLHVAPEFRAAVEPLLGPGTSVVITGDSLRADAAVPFRIEDDADEAPPE